MVVATDFADSGADNPAFPGMLGQTLPNTGTTPRETLADAGYFSENNVEAAHGAGTDPLIATGRLAHGEKVPDAPRGRIPTNATPRARMARKLRTQKGKAAYARRKVIVEPVFGQNENHPRRGPVAAPRPRPRTIGMASARRLPNLRKLSPTPWQRSRPPGEAAPAGLAPCQPRPPPENAASPHHQHVNESTPEDL